MNAIKTIFSFLIILASCEITFASKYYFKKIEEIKLISNKINKFTGQNWNLKKTKKLYFEGHVKLYNWPKDFPKSGEKITLEFKNFEFGDSYGFSIIDENGNVGHAFFVGSGILIGNISDNIKHGKSIHVRFAEITGEFDVFFKDNLICVPNLMKMFNKLNFDEKENLFRKICTIESYQSFSTMKNRDFMSIEFYYELFKNYPQHKNIIENSIKNDLISSSNRPCATFMIEIDSDSYGESSDKEKLDEYSIRKFLLDAKGNKKSKYYNKYNDKKEEMSAKAENFYKNKIPIKLHIKRTRNSMKVKIDYEKLGLIKEMELYPFNGYFSYYDFVTNKKVNSSEYFSKDMIVERSDVKCDSYIKEEYAREYENIQRLKIDITDFDNNFAKRINEFISNFKNLRYIEFYIDEEYSYVSQIKKTIRTNEKICIPETVSHICIPGNKILNFDNLENVKICEFFNFESSNSYKKKGDHLKDTIFVTEIVSKMPNLKKIIINKFEKKYQDNDSCYDEYKKYQVPDKIMREIMKFVSKKLKFLEEIHFGRVIFFNNYKIHFGILKNNKFYKSNFGKNFSDIKIKFQEI